MIGRLLVTDWAHIERAGIAPEGADGSKPQLQRRRLTEHEVVQQRNEDWSGEAKVSHCFQGIEELPGVRTCTLGINAALLFQSVYVVRLRVEHLQFGPAWGFLSSSLLLGFPQACL